VLAECIAALAANNLPVPEVGHELVDTSGAVLAEAELGWSELRVAVVDTDALAAFQQAGWQAFGMEEPELAACLMEALSEERK
jgi:hypothetical protein